MKMEKGLATRVLVLWVFKDRRNGEKKKVPYYGGFDSLLAYLLTSKAMESNIETFHTRFWHNYISQKIIFLLLNRTYTGVWIHSDPGNFLYPGDSTCVPLPHLCKSVFWRKKNPYNIFKLTYFIINVKSIHWRMRALIPLPTPPHPTRTKKWPTGICGLRNKNLKLFRFRLIFFYTYFICSSLNFVQKHQF